MADVDQVMGLERRLHQPGVRADRDLLEQLLHPLFAEFGASGRAFGREAVIAALVADPDVGEQVRDLRASEVAPGVVLVTYGTAGPERRTLRSSLWIREDDRWRLRFHHGSLVP